MYWSDRSMHGLRTPRQKIAFTTRPKIHSHSQIFRYVGSIFCLPHRPEFSDFFDLCLHWVSVVCANQDWLFVDLWFFTNLACCDLKIVCTYMKIKTKSILWFSEILKQYHVISGLTYRNYNSVWWTLCCPSHYYGKALKSIKFKFFQLNFLDKR